MTMQSENCMKTLIGISLLAGAFLSFSASAWIPYNYHVVELSGTPGFDGRFTCDSNPRRMAVGQQRAEALPKWAPRSGRWRREVD
jgi:hypothetical protein